MTLAVMSLGGLCFLLASWAALVPSRRAPVCPEAALGVVMAGALATLAVVFLAALVGLR